MFPPRHTHVFVFVLFCMLTGGTCIAQVFERPAVLSDHFFYRHGMFNPAQGTDTVQSELQVGRRAYTGLLNGVSHNYAQAYYNFGEENKGHLVGVSVVNVREGDYVQRNRAYLRYAKNIDLSTNWRMSLGVSVGLINHVFQGTIVNSGGSDMSPDYNIGLTLRSQQFSIGGSLQQVLSPTLTPVSDMLHYNQFWNVHVMKSFVMSQSFTLHLYALSSYRSADDWNLRVAPLLVIHDVLQTGVEYLSEQGVMALLGARDLSFSNAKIRGSMNVMISFLFFNTRKLSTTRDNVLELTIGYRF